MKKSNSTYSDLSIEEIRKRLSKHSPFKGYTNELPKKFVINNTNTSKKIVFVK